MYVIKRKEKIIMKKILDFIIFMLGGKCDITDEAVAEGLVSFEGQGRNEFGR
jgi:hypothetical protein